MSNQQPNPPHDHEPPRRGLSGFMIVVLLLLCGAIGLYFLVQSFPSALTGRDDQISLVYLIALGLVLVISTLGVRRLGTSDIARYLRYGLLWGVIFVLLAGGYSYRTEMRSFGNRIMGGLIPGYGGETGLNEFTYSRAEDGHFYIDAESSGVPIRFLVDSGASLIVLSPGDAERLGFDLTRVEFDQTFETANGIVRGASTRLSELWVGDRRLRNLSVSINEAPMSNSLLGIAFLRQLESYEVRGDHLILRWRTDGG